jgi:hypothetical protein
MNERLIAYTFSVADPDSSAAVGSSGALFTVVPFGATLVYACVSPMEDDSGATMDVQDDGVDIVTAIDASDHDVPGEWLSTHVGGTNAPIAIAAGSEISLDFNAVAVANRFDVVLLFLTGESWG